MKRFLLVMAALAISTSAFAQANGPVRQGNKCWAITDQRGFGFWDTCASHQEILDRNKRSGTRDIYDQARTNYDTSMPGGGGGGGGGGR
jgi:hypothetical protein